MAFGDIGGPVTELVLSCLTAGSGDVSISAGDAVKLTGAYEVSNEALDEDDIFGEALESVSENGVPVAVRVRGICRLAYSGTAPTVDGATGVVASSVTGTVKTPASGAGRGLVLHVDETAGEVDVLL